MSTFDEKLKITEPQQHVSEQPKDIDNMIKRSQKREQVDGKMKKVFNGFVRVFPIVAVNIFALVIIGLDKFVKAEWSWAIFEDEAFWFRYLSFQTANWIVAITYLVNAIRKMKSGVHEYINNLSTIQSFVDKDHENAFIEKQSEIETLRRKKEVLEDYVYNSMYQISIRHRIKSVEAFLKDFGSYTPTRRERLTHRKLQRLYWMLSFDWQREYLPSYKKIKFPKVTRSLLVSGVHPRQSESRFNTYRAGVFGTSAKLIAPNTMTTMLISLILLSFQFMFIKSDISSWLMFAMQVMLITWNTFMTLSYVGTIFQMTYIKSSEERRSDLELFTKREKTGNTDTQEILRIMNYKPEKGEKESK